MRKNGILLFICAIIFAFAGCGKAEEISAAEEPAEEPETWSVLIANNHMETAVALSEDDAETVSEILSAAQWGESLFDGPTDVTLTNHEGQCFKYSSADGFVNNVDGPSCCRLKAEEREVLNGIFSKYGILNRIGYMTAEYEFNYAYMSIELPPWWEYSIKEHQYGSEEPFGISFWPSGESGSLNLFCRSEYTEFCGTGVRNEPLELSSGHRADLVMRDFSDGESYLMYVAFRDIPGVYMVTLTEEAREWWGEYEEEILQILDTAKLGKPGISREESLEIAKSYIDYSNSEYDNAYSQFHFETGLWTVTFEKTYTTSCGHSYVTAEGEMMKILDVLDVLGIIEKNCAQEHELYETEYLEEKGIWILRFPDENGALSHAHCVSQRWEILEGYPAEQS